MAIFAVSSSLRAVRFCALGLFFASVVLGCDGRKADIPPAPLTSAKGGGGIRVQMAMLQTGTLAATQSFTGKTSPGQSTRITPETGGKLVELRVQNGQEVKAGEVLLRLDASRQHLALENAKVALKARLIDEDWANKDVVRKEKLVAKNALPRLQHEAALTQLQRAKVGVEQAELAIKNARRALVDTVLRAPHDGEVFALHVGLGDTVGPGMALLEVVNLQQLKVHIALAARMLSGLRKGQKVQVRVDEQMGRHLDGVIAAIAPKADLRTGLFDVEIHLDNPNPPQDGLVKKGATHQGQGRVRAGLIASVLIIDAIVDDTGSGSQVQLLVPSRALLRRDGKVGVFSLSDSKDAPLTAHFLELQIGRSSGAFSEILRGARAGKWVVLGEFNALAEGSPLHVERISLSPPKEKSASQPETEVSGKPLGHDVGAAP
ncbi:MAG: efflux RND transporter periplasmic adaptor subunit [Deltaproteobacteria bacterium]|nr:efflux RND transporter periplasmic adaptor subunit [Deltaproteobacteria bacterium]